MIIPTSTIRGFYAGFAAVVIWAFLPILIKSIVAHFDISYFLVLRFLLSTLLLSWVNHKIFKKLKLLSKKRIIIFFVVLGSNFYLQALALSQVSASWYVIIFALNPILTLLLLRHQFSAKSWKGITLAITGTFLFRLSQNDHLTIISISSLIALTGGMLTWSFYTILVKDLHNIFTDIEITGLSNLISFFASLVIWSLQGFPINGDLMEYSVEIILIGFIVPSAYYLYSYGIREAPTFTINTQYVEPVISLFFAGVFLHENLNGMQYLASIIILTGVFTTLKS